MRAGCAIAFILLGGCAALGGQKPVIENRFAGLAERVPLAPEPITLSVSTSPVKDAAGGVRLDELSGEAQAALITVTGGKPPARVGRDTTSERGAVEVLDQFARQLEVAIRPVGFLPPADRVDAIRVSLEVAPNHAQSWRITGWTQATNGQRVIELGKLTDVAGSKVSAEIGLAIADFIPGAKMSGESSRTATRDTLLHDTTDFSAGIDAEGRAWLDETAGWRDNLTHNLAIDAGVSARSDAVTKARHYVAFSDLRRADGTPAAPRSIRLKDVAFLEPEVSDKAICGIARLEYRIRHVTAGEETYTESDDQITFKTGNVETAFLLSSPPYKPLYGLAVRGSYVSYFATGSRPAGLYFASLDEATQFRNWLRETKAPRRLQNAEIGLLEDVNVLRPLTPSELANLAPVLSSDSIGVRIASDRGAGCVGPSKPAETLAVSASQQEGSSGKR
jgi:hypothetical protein